MQKKKKVKIFQTYWKRLQVCRLCTALSCLCSKNNKRVKKKGPIKWRWKKNVKGKKWPSSHQWKDLFFSLYAVLSGTFLMRNLEKQQKQQQQAQEQEIRAEADHAHRRCKRCCVISFLKWSGKTQSLQLMVWDVGEGVMAWLFPTLGPLQPFRG